jgi:hypothetical protein
MNEEKTIEEIKLMRIDDVLQAFYEKVEYEYKLLDFEIIEHEWRNFDLETFQLSLVFNLPWYDHQKLVISTIMSNAAQRLITDISIRDTTITLTAFIRRIIMQGSLLK